VTFFSIIFPLKTGRIITVGLFLPTSNGKRVIIHIKLKQNKIHTFNLIFFFFSARSMFGGKGLKNTYNLSANEVLIFFRNLKTSLK